MFGGYIKVKNIVPRLPHYNDQTYKDKISYRKLEFEQLIVNTGRELMCSGMVCRSSFTCVFRRVTLVSNPVISYEEGKKDGIVASTNRTHSLSSL